MSKIKPIEECDAKGRLTHHRNSNGFERWWEYNAKGRIIHYRDSDGNEFWYWKGKITKDPINILLIHKQIRDKAVSAK